MKESKKQRVRKENKEDNTCNQKTKKPKEEEYCRIK